MPPLKVEYSPGLVAGSVAISILAAGAAFSLAERMRRAPGRLMRTGWLLGGSVAMGIGIWSMHYLGMLAVRLPVEVRYNVPVVVLSLLLAIVAAAVALTIVGGSSLNGRRLLVGGLLMGSGIGGMHYTGMAAMRMPAMHHYSPVMVALSIAVAVGMSCLALGLGFSLRRKGRGNERSRLLGATVMGLAIASMHYIAMAGVTYTPEAMAYSTAHTVRITLLGEWAIVIATALVLAAALGSAASDRRQFEELQEAQEKLLAMQAELLQQASELKESQQRLLEANALLNELSIRDGLTGLHNRRHFDAVLDTEWRRALRRAERVSLLLVDIDHFKAVNDELGHQYGDEVLRQVVQAVESVPKRSHDLVARYGGEEFAIVLPTAGLEIGVRMAEEIRRVVEELGIAHPNSSVGPVVTVSIGVACRVPALGHTVEQLIHDADTALYVAKQNGRNRVEVSVGISPEEAELLRQPGAVGRG